MKTCIKCHKEQPLSEFYRVAKNKDGLTGTCKTCTRKRSAAHERALRKTPEGRRAQRAKHLKHYYKLSLEDYEAMVAAQDGCCMACGDPVEENMDVDHDHRCCPDRWSCGQCLRDLLCRRCNSVLGKVGDDIGILEALVKYLARWNENFLVGRGSR